MSYATSTIYATPEIEIATAETVVTRPRRLSLGLDLKSAPVSAKQQTSRLMQVMQWAKGHLPWALSAGVLGAELLFHAPMVMVGAGMAGLTLQIVRSIIRRSPAMQQHLAVVLQKLGITKARIPTLAMGVAGGAWLTAASRAMLFLQAAEQYFQTTFGGASAATTAIPLVFGALRVIFVLYLGIALVRVINAFRNNEDWQTAAGISHDCYPLYRSRRCLKHDDCGLKMSP